MTDRTTSGTRLAQIWDAFREAGRQIVEEQDITEAELRAGATYLQEVANQGGLVDLLELTFQTAAAENVAQVRDNVKANVEGPLYKAGAPVRSDGVLYDRSPGPHSERLTVTGQVTDSRSGRPVPGAKLDFWQADENGDYDLDGYNLRGVLVTDADGRYRLETIVPGSYPTHVDDLVSELYERMGRSSYRSAHIHFKVWVDGTEVLTSQFFDADSEYLDIDALAGAVRPELVVRRTAHSDADSDRRQFDMTFDVPVSLTGNTA